MKLHHEPAVLVLTRQAVPTIDRSKYASASGLVRGAYVLADAPDGRPDVLLLATGSEVALCLEAHERLKAEGIKSRLVSMPSWELFDDQPQEYRDTRAATRSDRASLGGAGLDVRLGQIRRRRGAEHRHALVRCISAVEGIDEEVWLYARGCRGSRQGATAAADRCQEMSNSGR